MSKLVKNFAAIVDTCFAFQKVRNNEFVIKIANL